ncbi:Probable glutamine-binding protein GlnH [Mycobacteroides abscessus subsp. massiliense]|nr:Probable glutamine-binding protein GlnH [Mycobacteroides abscessus subsp. massiliense]
MSTDDSILAGLMSQDPYLHIIGPNMSDEPYGIGMKHGTWNALYRKWLSVLGPAPAPPSARYRD